MKRLVVVALLLVVGGLALAATLPAAGRWRRALADGRGGYGGHGGGEGAGTDGVPVERVVKRDFVHLVPADGNLRARLTTPLLVPSTPGGGSCRIGWVAPDGARVHAGDVVVRFDPSDIEKALADAEDDLASARLKTDKEAAGDRADIGKLERDAAMARSELTNARQFAKKDAVVFSRHDIIESEIDQDLSIAKERHAREQRGSLLEQGRAGIGLLAVDIRQAERKIRQAREGLATLQVKAPHDGILNLVRDRDGSPPRVGDVVWGGMPLAEIPDLAVMQAEVYVLEADAGGMAVGRPAVVTVESSPGVEFAARIVRVDALAKPRLRGSPVQFFAVTLGLARTDPQRMKPGQRVQAMLRLDEVRGALVVPRQAVFERDGRRIVYRRRGDDSAFDPVTVRLGPTDMGMAVVESGLRAGDAVALRDPARAPSSPAAPGAKPFPGADTPGAASGAPAGGAAPTR